MYRRAPHHSIPDLQKDLDNNLAYDMITRLKEIFQESVRTERFETVRAFHACMIKEGQTVSSYLLKMKSHIDRLACFGVVMPKELATDMILNSLIESFDPFIMNYNINGLNKTIPELHGMLITSEKSLPKKISHVLMSNRPLNRRRRQRPSNGIYECRLGNINKKGISQLQKSRILKANENDSFDICESCLHGKMTKAPFSGTNEREKNLLGIIHSDVCGPFKPMSRYGERYLISFTNGCSQYGYVYLMKHKHEAFEIFKMFQSEMKNQLNKTIKVLLSDRGG
ncbi:hypothetical protein L1887_32240 [Cichorium endivia]|nr:hypothetical protein L1887_32240 [Cichorium endivia]